MYEIAVSQYYEAMVVIQQVIHTAGSTEPSRPMTSANRTNSIEMLDKAKKAMSGLHCPSRN
jgi:hypothetical protein